VFSVEEFVEQTADGAFAVDHNLRILAWNKAATALLGHTPDQVIGHPCHTILLGTNGDGDAVCQRRCEPLKCALAGRLPSSYELRSVTASGESVWLSVSVVSLPRGDDEPGQLVHIFRPIGRQKQLEAFVRQTVTSAAEHLTASTDEANVAPDRAATLTPRERDVLQHIRRGRTTREIAAALGISTATVRTHTQHVLDKLGVRSKLAAAVYADKQGLA
jgi:PAS domain S-box-containing protein